MTFWQEVIKAVVSGVTTGIIGGLFVGIGQGISRIWLEPWLLKLKREHDKITKKGIKHIKKIVIKR